MSWIGLELELRANGLYRNGRGAESLGMAGADSTVSDNPLTAIGGNPAAFTLNGDAHFQFSATGALGSARYDSPLNERSRMDVAGGFPEFGVTYPTLGGKATVGLGAVVDVARQSDWRYTDTPGGVDGATSYGRLRHESRFVVIRPSAGAAVKLSERWSLGASLGVIYQELDFRAPYIFQRHPVLAGFKTDLDLDTNGIGFNGDVGLLYKHNDRLRIGLSYRTPTSITSQGSAVGDLRAQFDSVGLGSAPSTFRYDAEAELDLPQSVALGIYWAFSDRGRLAVEGNWAQWSSFDYMGIQLTGGNNAAVNDTVGSTTIIDRVPLQWEDRFGARVGLEFDLTDAFTWRGGYSYSSSPMRTAYVTPLNAEIIEHTLATGFDYSWDRWTVSVGYQLGVPRNVAVAESRYLSGEYSHSSVRALSHLFSVGIGYRL